MNDTGTKWLVPDHATLNRRVQAADKPGEHLWIMAASWQVAGPRAISDGAPVELDRENLLMLVGPGCYKCEQHFSNRVARQPCRGSMTDLQT